MANQLLKWLLITSITLVSSTLLMFVAAYIAIFNEAAAYYGVTISKVVLLSNTFNMFYLIITPFIFPWLKKKYTLIVQIAVVLIALGCLGRYLCQGSYNTALVWSILVAISHVPVITAPYGLLGLFEPSKRGYASSIPLFIPTLGINFSILYGMAYIASQSSIIDNSASTASLSTKIQSLNFIIAIIGILGAVITIVLLNVLKNEVRALNQESEDARNTKSCLQSLRSQFRRVKEFVPVVLGWGTILGMHWTYGGMFGIFLDGSGLSHKQIALMGLYANLSSAVFCNLGNWIANHTKLSNSTIIFFLNVAGFLGSLFIQASTSLPQPIFHQKWALIISIIILRAGFSSFVSLCLVQLGDFGPSVLVSSVFFYVANGTNLLGNYLVDSLNNTKSLAIMSSIIWLCIFVVHIVHTKKSASQNGAIELASEDNVSKKLQYQMQSK